MREHHQPQQQQPKYGEQYNSMGESHVMKLYEFLKNFEHWMDLKLYFTEFHHTHNRAAWHCEKFEFEQWTWISNTRYDEVKRTQCTTLEKAIPFMWGEREEKI